MKKEKKTHLINLTKLSTKANKNKNTSQVGV